MGTPAPVGPAPPPGPRSGPPERPERTGEHGPPRVLAGGGERPPRDAPTPDSARPSGRGVTPLAVRTFAGKGPLREGGNPLGRGPLVHGKPSVGGRRETSRPPGGGDGTRPVPQRRGSRGSLRPSWDPVTAGPATGARARPAGAVRGRRPTRGRRRRGGPGPRGVDGRRVSRESNPDSQLGRMARYHYDRNSQSLPGIEPGHPTWKDGSLPLRQKLGPGGVPGGPRRGPRGGRGRDGATRT